jgi:excisionase family DNA binding protein
MLQVSIWKVYELLQDGTIRGVKVGQQWRVKVDAVEAYLAQGEQGAAEEAERSAE